MNQGEFTGVFCARPQNFAWFLGAGASRAAGLPTATDILWDMKRRFYCQEENQEITRHDIQNQAVGDRIQSFMDSRGFPPLGASNEYSAYFEKIFGRDKEKQRRYLKAILDEERVTLSVGNRVLGALLSSGLCRAAFTTNFDTVVERAIAEVAGASLSAYHLEGSSAAVQALNNEEFPLYCKLHGDFRYDSLKNLPDELVTQNADLSECLINAGNRFGFVVAGYSGRDESIMDLFRSVLTSQNPFPHGLFWLGMKGSHVLSAVSSLLEDARTRGGTAEFIEIETFDALMLRLWRSITSKSAELDARVRKAEVTDVDIPLPPAGTRKPVIRLNALPVLKAPTHSLGLAFRQTTPLNHARRVRDQAKAHLILAQSQDILCWGDEAAIKQTFGTEVVSFQRVALPDNISRPDTLHLKGFFEEALCWALARGKPLSTRSLRMGAFLIANPSSRGVERLDQLKAIAGGVAGDVGNLQTIPNERHPKPEQVRWAEALHVSLEQKDGRTWLLLEPYIWIWPQRARERAVPFLEQRRGDRFNSKHDALLTAWIGLILGTDERNTEVTVRAFDSEAGIANPSFSIGTRTAFSRRSAS